jgi:hypothetical protein
MARLPVVAAYPRLQQKLHEACGLGEVERDILSARPCEDYGAGGLLISRSSTSKTNVAPGLIEGGAPLSP